MKITKAQLKQTIKEEISKTLSEGEYDIDLRDYGVEEDPRSPQEHQQEDLNDILKKLSDPEQREQVKAALEQSGVLELDPIENKKAIAFIMNAHRQHADGVLDSILVQIADEVLKVNV